MEMFKNIINFFGRIPGRYFPRLAARLAVI
jgi:hypothetical protein